MLLLLCIRAKAFIKLLKCPHSKYTYVHYSKCLWWCCYCMLHRIILAHLLKHQLLLFGIQLSRFLLLLKFASLLSWSVFFLTFSHCQSYCFFSSSNLHRNCVHVYKCDCAIYVLHTESNTCASNLIYYICHSNEFTYIFQIWNHCTADYNGEIIPSE